MRILKITHDPLTITYELNDTQNMVITRCPDSTWAVYLPHKDPLTSTNPEEAAKEMGAWLYKLSEVIMEEAGNFGKIDVIKIS
jgi:hypothetical protein